MRSWTICANRAVFCYIVHAKWLRNLSSLDDQLIQDSLSWQIRLAQVGLFYLEYSKLKVVDLFGLMEAKHCKSMRLSRFSRGGWN